MASLLTPVLVHRVGPQIFPEKDRVILKQYAPGTDDISRRVIKDAKNLKEEETKEQLNEAISTYSHRHRGDLHEIFATRAHEISKQLGVDISGVSDDSAALIGTYFMHEYSIQSAALFNPSAVPHWDQSGVPEGSIRFILSLRSSGERHISSISFRTGILDSRGRIVLDPTAKLCSMPAMTDDVNFKFPDEATDISERVIFPFRPSQVFGIEDVRFVKFVDDDKSYRYYGTLTAFDGVTPRPEFISTVDFKSFRFEQLTGDIENKGMALFPRRINGRYYMTSRQDDESIMMMDSDSILHFENPKVIMSPEYAWELFKIGNCGSPLETEKGWLLLTHHVGSLRQYSYGVTLLDLNDPYKVIARLKKPLMVPTEAEREGYVPNVVYGCGGLIHGDLLLIPYAVSDSTSSFAVAKLADIFAALGV